MIALTIAATLAVLAPLAWLLVETSRRRLLYLALPLLVAAPLAFYAYGTSLLGYAAPSALPPVWSLVSASVDDKARLVYLLVRIDVETEPRLYVIADDFERNRKKAGGAQAALGKGLPVAGRKGVAGADQNEGEFVMYVLPPIAASKGG